MPCKKKVRRTFYICHEDLLEYERIKNRINEWRKANGLKDVAEYEIFHVMLELFKTYGVRRFAEMLL